MTINTQLHLTSYVTIAFSLVTVTASIGAANAVPQDDLTTNPKIVDTAHLMYESVAAVVGSNPLTLSNSTAGDSSEIDLNLLQILPTPQA
jgi:hypothetical protein